MFYYFFSNVVIFSRKRLIILVGIPIIFLVLFKTYGVIVHEVYPSPIPYLPGDKMIGVPHGLVWGEIW